MAQVTDLFDAISSDPREVRALRRDSISWFRSRRNRYLQRLIEWSRQASPSAVADHWQSLVSVINSAAVGGYLDLRKSLAESLLIRFTSDDGFTGRYDEAAIFESLLVKWISPGRLREAFIKWTDSRRKTLSTEEYSSFVRTLPFELSFFPAWTWRLFNTLLDEKLDPVSFGVVPSPDQLARVKPELRQRFWRHLEQTSRYQQLIETFEAVSELDSVITERSVHIAALVRLGRIEEAIDLIALLRAEAEKKGSDLRGPSTVILSQESLRPDPHGNGLSDVRDDITEAQAAVVTAETLLIQSILSRTDLPDSLYQRLATYRLHPATLRRTWQYLRNRLGNSPSSQLAEELLRPLERLIQQCEMDSAMVLLGVHLRNLASRPCSGIERQFRNAFWQRLNEGCLLPFELQAVYDAIISLDSVDERLTWLEQVNQRLCHPRLAFDLAQLQEDSRPDLALELCFATLQLQSIHGRYDFEVGRRALNLLQVLSRSSTDDSCHRRLEEIAETYRHCAAPAIVFALEGYRRGLHPAKDSTPPEDASRKGQQIAELIAATLLAHKTEDRFVEFVIRICRVVLDDQGFRAVISELDSDQLPSLALLLLAQTDLAIGDYEAGERRVSRILERSPEDVQALVLRAQCLRSQHRNEAALQACQQALRIAPSNQSARIETLTIRRTIDQGLQGMLALIDEWTSSETNLVDRARSRLPLFWAIAANREAIAESLAWYRSGESNEEAARYLARSLYYSGQMGAAEAFYTLVSIKQIRFGDALFLERIKRLRQVFGGKPLEIDEAIDVAERFVQSFSVQGSHAESDRSSEDDTEKCLQRLVCPDILIERALQISSIRDQKTGPICLVTASLGHGGAERQVAYSAIGLSKVTNQLREVILICRNLSSHQADFFLRDVEAQGVKVDSPELDRGQTLADEIARESDFQRRQVLELLDAWPERQGRESIITYFRAFERLRPSVAYPWQDKTNIHAGIAAILAGVPRVVMSGRSMSPLRFSVGFETDQVSYQLLLRRPGVTLVNNSRAGADDYGRWLNMPFQEIEVIHNGYDFETIDQRCAASDSFTLRDALGIPRDALIIGTVGRMDEVKRPRLALEVLERVMKEDDRVYAVMIGGGPMQDEIRRQAQALSVNDRFRFPGVQSPVEPWMAMLDLMLLTSRTEGLPNVLIEAQAVGTPVASTHVGGAAETFEDGMTGVLFRSDDPALMASQILELMRHGDLSTMQQRARAHARSHFSIDRMIKRTLEVLTDEACCC